MILVGLRKSDKIFVDISTFSQGTKYVHQAFNDQFSAGPAAKTREVVKLEPTDL